MKNIFGEDCSKDVALSHSYVEKNACNFFKIAIKKIKLCLEKMTKDKDINEDIEIEFDTFRNEHAIMFRGKRTGILYNLDLYELTQEYGGSCDIEGVYAAHRECGTTNLKKNICSANYRFLKSLDDSEWL